MSHRKAASAVSPSLRFGTSETLDLSNIGFPRTGVSKENVLPYGTAGIRRPDFSADHVKQFVHAYADLAVAEMSQPGVSRKPVIVCWDTRQPSRDLYPLAVAILRHRGIDVLVPEGPVSTPIASYAAKKYGAYGVVNLTASHNPYQQGGIKLLDGNGVNLDTARTQRVEAFQISPTNQRLPGEQSGSQTTVDPGLAYFDGLKASGIVDLPAIARSGLKVAVDPQYGTGTPLVQFLRDNGVDVVTIGTDRLPPTGYNQPSEPIEANLGALQAAVTQQQCDLGLATDCDADRNGLVTMEGRLVPYNDILALSLRYLAQRQKQDGMLVRSQATSHQLDELYRQYCAEQEVSPEIRETPVGFKYVGGAIEASRPSGRRKVLLGGESSGGGSSAYHVVSEKDGIFMNLLLLGAAAELKRQHKTVFQGLKEMKGALLNRYDFQELAVTLPDEKSKQAVLRAFARYLPEPKNGLQRAFHTIKGFLLGPLHLGGLPVDFATSRAKAEGLRQRYGTQDGTKIYFQGGSWLLVRASGTEPKVRIYLEGIASASSGDTGEAQKTASLSRELLQSAVRETVFKIAPTAKITVQ